MPFPLHCKKYDFRFFLKSSGGEVKSNEFSVLFNVKLFPKISAKEIIVVLNSIMLVCD